MILSGADRELLFLAYEHGGSAYHQHLIAFAHAKGSWQLCFAAGFSTRTIPVDYSEEKRLEALRKGMLSGVIKDELGTTSARGDRF